jgi:diguanylate cyclase (GGDEF)-like protein
MTTFKDTKQDLDTSSFLLGDERMTTDQFDLTPVAESILEASNVNKEPCLVVLRGTDVGKVMKLNDGPVVIGRSLDCSAVMREESISRHHAKINITETGEIVAEDLGSTNGIFLNGTRVTKTTLKSDDKLLLGRRTVLKLMFQDQIEQLYQQEIYNSSTRDGLTGIYNRRFLDERIDSDISFSRRHRIPFTFIMFDIDLFKKVNDKYGHPSGDEVLVAIAKIIGDIIRTEDVFGRFGGEEFAILAPRIDLDGATIFGERIRQHISELEIPAKDGSDTIIKVTVSVGAVTVHPEAIVDTATVISVTDENLYKAKKAGRDKVVTSIVK